MTCNWLVGRGKAEEVGEEENVELPPSTSLAGKIHKTLMSQVAAGKKHGNINEVDAVKFELKKSEISQLEKMGLVPMVNEYGKLWLSLQKHYLQETISASDLFSSSCIRLCNQSSAGFPKQKSF
jgi:S-adenosylmethionine hydrolase